MIETRVAQFRAGGRIRINLSQIIEHGVDRRMQTVEIHSVKTCFRALWINPAVEFAEPLNKLGHHGVSPHPSREPAEPGERGIRICVFAAAADVAMDPR